MPNATPEETRRLVDALPEEALLQFIWEILDAPCAPAPCAPAPSAPVPSEPAPDHR